MNNIIIGSIVLCKLMILEPQNSMTTIDSINGVPQSKGATGNQILDQFNVIDKKNIETKTKEIEKDGEHIAIVGEVEEIRSVTKYIKNSETNKYKKNQFKMLVVKTEKIDRLFIDPSACGLAEELLEQDKKTEKIQKEVVKKEPKKNALPKINNNEYIVVPADTVLGDEYEVITDEKLEKKILEAIQQNDKKIVIEDEVKIKDKEKQLESELLSSQSKTFDTPLEEPIKEEPQKIEVSKEEPKTEIKETVPSEDIEMFDFFAKEPKKEAQKIVKKEEPKIEKKKEEPKKIETSKIKDEISSEEKSVLSEALEIAF